MQKISVLGFIVICIILATTITTIAAEKESYSWEETTPGNWQVRDTTNNVYVKNAIIQEKAGPGYYYYIILDGKMMTEDNTYLGVPLMVNRDHDGAFGRVLTGAEELVAQHPEMIIDMNAALPETSATFSYEQALEIVDATPYYSMGRYYNDPNENNIWSITCYGTFPCDFVKICCFGNETGNETFLITRVATSPSVIYTKTNPSITDYEEALRALH